jgi:Ca2+-binding EF-hand superfamily protein
MFNKKTIKTVSKSVQKRLEKLFKIHDMNNNGFIEVDELKEITKLLDGIEGSDLELKVKEDLTKFDQNGDNRKN